MSGLAFFKGCGTTYLDCLDRDRQLDLVIVVRERVLDRVVSIQSVDDAATEDIPDRAVPGRGLILFDRCIARVSDTALVVSQIPSTASGRSRRMHRHEHEAGRKGSLTSCPLRF